MFSTFGVCGSLRASLEADEVSGTVAQNAPPITENEQFEFEFVDFTNDQSPNSDVELSHPTVASKHEDGLGSTKDKDLDQETKGDASSSNENEVEASSAVKFYIEPDSNVEFTHRTIDLKLEDGPELTKDDDMDQGTKEYISILSNVNKAEASSAVEFYRSPNSDVEFSHRIVASKPEDDLGTTRDEDVDQETKENASSSNENEVEGSSAVKFDQFPNSDVELRYRSIASKPEDGPESTKDDVDQETKKDTSVSSNKNKAEGLSAVKIYLFDTIVALLGFIVPISAFLIGLENRNECPGNLYLPYVVSIMGLFSFLILSFAASKITDGDFHILEEYERNLIEMCSVLLAFLWLGEFALFWSMDVSFDSSAANYCYLWFYIFVVIWNIFLVLAYGIGYGLLFLDAKDLTRDGKRKPRRDSWNWRSIYDTDESE